MAAKKSGASTSQSVMAKQGSAGLSRQPMGATTAAKTPPPTKNAARNSKAMEASEKDVPSTWTCKQCLKLSFFFDGTGNNLESDIGTLEHSNVVRLYRAHNRDNPTIGVYRFYIPGIGTYFKDVGDAGGTAGLAFSAGGQKRLDWAFKEFDKLIAAASSPPLSIKVAVFGFSRGAALARAFCRDLAKRCAPCTTAEGTGFKLKSNGVPIEIYFLGIFDTVASVGIPMSANNAKRKAVVKFVSKVVKPKVFSGQPELYCLAFGKGSIDPAPGPCDGHMDWAKDLTIPPLVKSCVHMIAAHEVRNSFPVDSTANGNQYPPSVVEMVYPGSHSDVGGGYRPQEGARAPHYGEMLNLIPLRVMYDKACQAGVPLRPLSSFKTETEKKDFAIDKEGAERFKILNDYFTHYMNTVGWGGGNLGGDILLHTKMYYRWRFLHIQRAQEAHGNHTQTEEEQAIARNEQVFSKERAALEKSVAQKRDAFHAAERRALNYEKILQNEKVNRAKFGTPIRPGLESETQAARDKADQAQDACLREEDKLRTAANDSSLMEAATRYDEELMEDAEAIRQWMREDKTLKLRPHYQAMMDAYAEVFMAEGMPLQDKKIIAFFDRYIHDSLAGFNLDETRRSDPRVVYIGGDRKLLATKAHASPEKLPASPSKVPSLQKVRQVMEKDAQLGLKDVTQVAAQGSQMR